MIEPMVCENQMKLNWDIQFGLLGRGDAIFGSLCQVDDIQALPVCDSFLGDFIWKIHLNKSTNAREKEERERLIVRVH